MSTGTHAARTEPWTFRPQRARATLATWHGYMWALVVALDFYLLSNPLVFEPAFGVSLARATLLTAIALVATVPRLCRPRVSWLLLAFMLWALASATWSQSPSSTLAAWGQYSVVAALAVAIAAQTTPRVMIAGLGLGGVLVASLSWYAHIQGLPGASYETLDGLRIAGVGTNLNILAYTLIIAFGALAARVPASWLGRAAWAGAFALVGFTIYAAASTTGFSAAVAVVATALVVRAIERFGTWLLGSRLRLWALVAGFAATLAGSFYVVTRVVGEDTHTFAGRLPFWVAAWDAAQDQLLIGFGWGAVWAHPWLLAPDNPVANEIYANAGFFLTHGHNSLVDVLLELGLVGVTLIAAMHAGILITGARGVVRAVAHRSTSTYGRFLVVTLAGITVFGISEPLAVVPLGWWSLVLLLHARPDEEPSR